jgi:hypothetical protein
MRSKTAPLKEFIQGKSISVGIESQVKAYNAMTAIKEHQKNRSVPPPSDV